MPIYEYKCEDCGKVFEYQQRITDAPLEFCPAEICDSAEHKGKGRVHRIISKNIGLIFKGNGFYITDYARKNSSAATPDRNGTSSKNGSTATEKVSNENLENK